MYRLIVGLCFVTLALSSPPLARSRKEIEAFKNFLENSQSDDGLQLKTRMAANPNANEWENSGKFQGDILLHDSQIEEMVEDYAGGRNALNRDGSRWPDGVVVWQFGEGQFDEAQKNAIYESIKEIEEKTCIRFRDRTPGDRIFVTITGNPTGCSASVGYLPLPGVNRMNLAPNVPPLGCFRPTTIIHEWLHNLGFHHMQSTYNRDDYVEILWENIVPTMVHNFVGFTDTFVSNLDTDYEYTSCMHYNAFAFSRNGEPTVQALHSHEGVMGQRLVVTDYDWLRLNRQYDCPGAWD